MPEYDPDEIEMGFHDEQLPEDVEPLTEAELAERDADDLRAAENPDAWLSASDEEITTVPECCWQNFLEWIEGRREHPFDEHKDHEQRN